MSVDNFEFMPTAENWEKPVLGPLSPYMPHALALDQNQASVVRR